MADVELSYKGSTIGSLSASGTLTMETQGKYCEDDITLTYTSPGGGTVPARLINHIEVTPTTDITSGNRLNVNLTANTPCVILATIDTVPAAPDASQYIALYVMFGYTSYAQNSYGYILRPAGTVGTDVWAAYNASTGVLGLGGSYGHLLAGTKYHVYQFELGV